MAEETKTGLQPTDPDPLAGIRTILTEAGRDATNLEEGIRRLVDEVQELAKNAETYRQDLIDQALAEGTRAHGGSFAKEAYRTALEATNLDAIKLMRDDWKRVADSTIPDGFVH